MTTEGEDLMVFLESEDKLAGDSVSTTVPLYPTEEVFWNDSRYLREDDWGRSFLLDEGKLVFLDFGPDGREKFFLKGNLGSFELLRKGDRLFVIDYFTSEPGPVGG